MSLRIWLPLDGDLRNQGISEITIAPGANAAIQNNGKIGKCYCPATIDLTDLNNLSFDNSSFCFWAKTSATSSWQLIIGIDNSSLSQIHGIYVADSSRYKLEYNPSLNVYGAEISQWHHYAFIIKNGSSQVYYDGILKATSTEAVTNDIIGRLRLGVGTAISLNDVRIYDHCLSATEVREIAQGLILHYKLDDQYSESTTNLASTSTGGWNNSGTCTRTTNDTTIPNPPTTSNTYSIRATSDGSMAAQIGTTSENHPSKTIIASTYVWLDGTQDSSAFYLRSVKTDGSVGSLLYKGNANPTTWPQRQWIRIATNAITTASDATKFYICTYVNKNTEVRAFNGWQIEEKDHATPWTTPGTTRTSVNIQDSSGYNHNGIINGILTLSNDTPRYSACAVFNGTNTRIKVPNLTPDAITVSFWMKRNANTGTRQFLYTSWSGVTCELTTSGTTTFAVNKSSYPTISGSTITTSTGWIHYCGTFDTTNGLRLYENGVLKSSNTSNLNAISWNISTNYIGYYNTYYNGLMSDFRIYCTPLLDTDIKQLYNVSMKVDKNQNIHNFELIEKNYNIFSATPWCNGFNTHAPATSPFINFNSNGESQFTTNNSSAGTDYLEITPGIYEYDYTISVNSGNQFYIGFERYDANKTSRSNNACVYTYSTKPSTNIVKQRYKGTVDLSTDSVNQLKYIALRILNGWSGTTSGVTGQATIHNFSLRLQSAAVNPKITKVGQLISDEFKEYSSARFYKDHIIEANQFIER